MKNRLRHLLASALLLASSQVLADTYVFSYKSANGLSASGTFEGQAAGDLVTNISQIMLSIQGGPLRPAALLSFWAIPGTSGEPYSLSANRKLNNFWFIDPAGLDASGRYLNDGAYGLALIGNLSTPLSELAGKNLDYIRDGSNTLAFGPLSTAWHLSVQPVPEPASLALLCGGLMVVGAACRGRNQARPPST